MKVALYVRVSTEEQFQEGFSIEGQIQTLTDFCKVHKHQIIDVYKDEGISAKTMNRPALSQLLQDASKGMFDMVMVWKISRLSRKQLDFLNIIETLEKQNVAFFSLSENIDASTPTGKAMLQMMGSFAELERNQIVENVKMGMNQRANEGNWNGGSSLGYKSENKQLVIVEDEAFIVRYIFNLYINGKGYKAIANKLNKEGYKTKRGKAFSINSIRTVITNPLYAGFIRFNQVENWSEKRRQGKNEKPMIKEGKHEQIITMDVWNKAQAMFKKKSHKPTKTFLGSFPLTGLLRCPVCGQGMIGHKAKRSNKSNEYIRYYQCGNFHYKGSSVCSSNLVVADDAEEYVFKRLHLLSRNKQVLSNVLGKVNQELKKHKQPLEEQLKQTEKEIKNNEKVIELYLSNFEKKQLNSKSLLRKIENLEKNSETLLARKKAIESELRKPSVQSIEFNDVFDVLSQINIALKNVSHEQQKHVLHSIINRITVNEGKRPKERSIKDIELFFDTSLEDFVLTYGTVHPD